MKRLFYFTLCTLILLSSAACGRKKNEQTEKITVRTALPSFRIFQDKVETRGIVEAVDQAVLSTITIGKLERLTVKEGDKVKKGQILFCSDSQNLENRCTLAREMVKIAKERVHTREADLKLAKVSFDKAQTDFRRNSNLYKGHAVSQDKYETFELAFRKAKLSIEQAQAALATARAEVGFAEATLNIAEKHLSDSIVKAPYDGIITAKMRNENEFCSAGTPVLRIERPLPKRISVIISGIHYPRVDLAKTKMEVFFAGKLLCTVPVTIPGRTIDPASRTFELKADLPEKFALPSGTMCEIRIIFGQRKNLAVPEEAVLFRNNSTFSVYEEKNGKVKSIMIEPGLTQNGYTEILNSSALAGHRIIVSGHYFVNDGSAVQESK